MVPLSMGSLPSVRRQHLLSEFAGLKQACPEGVYVSLTPGDPTLWSAVLFVRDGPYAPAVLRFHISFPSSYPSLPPVVTFSTDIFHPLITPLTTFMYSTDVHEGGTASATDDERLPPGGFSLRHGFPHWFGRGNRNGPAEDQKSHEKQMLTTPKPVGHATMITPESAGKAAAASYTTTSTSHVSAYDILKYIRGTFDDEELLDTVPLEAAGNPGAWHAWRTHRRKLGKIRDEPVQEQDGAEGAASSPIVEDIPASAPDQDPNARSQSTVREPGEWNWEGVWEDRVRKGVQASISESVLYGGATALPDELIKFLPLEESEVDSVKENIRRTLGAST